MADDDCMCRASEYYQPEILTADSIPSLQRLCERSLAESAVEPRTCLQIMEYADACGAEVLKQFCLGVRPSPHICSSTAFIYCILSSNLSDTFSKKLCQVVGSLPSHAHCTASVYCTSSTLSSTLSSSSAQR